MGLGVVLSLDSQRSNRVASDLDLELAVAYFQLSRQWPTSLSAAKVDDLPNQPVTVYRRKPCKADVLINNKEST
jgi:hypothetical protein